MRPNLRPPQKPARPASPASSDESLLDDEPLLGDGDVPMRNGPRNIADDEPPPPPRPAPKAASARMPAAPAPAPSKPSVSGRVPAAKTEAPKPAAKTSARVAPPVKPPVQDDDEIEEEEDIDFDETVEATKEMPAPKPVKKGSAREDAHQSGRRVVSTKQSRAAEDEDDSPRTSKRTSAKRSGQMKAAPGKGIPKLYLIGGLVALVLIAVVAIGYKPFMISQYKGAMTTGATVQERKESAEKFYNAYPDDAFYAFEEFVSTSDAALREAAIFGLSKVGDSARSVNKGESERRGHALEALLRTLKSADGPTKLQILAALKPIGEKVSAPAESTGDGKSTPNDKQAKELATALIPLTEPTGDLDLRRESLDVLDQLRQPGVCKQMIMLASSDPQLKDAARAAIPMTVLPEAAGDLLRAMKSEDKNLAETAKRAFVGIRDSAPSKDLLPLVGDPSADVRREIVEALGKRSADNIAQQGITKALKDSDAAIRLLAAKAVPTTGISGGYAALKDLSKDPDENVRIASGETFGKLRDPDSYTALLDCFKNGLDGKALDAYVKALGSRSRGKDMKNIGMVIGLLDTNPNSEASLREALLLLSNNGAGPSRDRIRKAWSAAQWKQWYEKINEREKLRAEANAAVKEASAQRNADRQTFVKIKNDIEKAMDKLEKAHAMCQPDDAEDAKDFEKELKAASIAKDYFIKGASFDLR